MATTNFSAVEAPVNGTGDSVALSASGGAAMDASAASVFTLTPTAAQTITVSGSVAGQRIALIVLTSGASSYTQTFGTGFKTTGTLATGTSTGKYFIINFVSDGTNVYEVSRTTAI